MRTSLVLLAATAFVSCNESASAATPKPQPILGAQARALISKGAVLVDVRTPDEFAEQHLDGARNLPLNELGRQLAALPKDQTIIVYCAVGSRSASAATMLARAGFDVRNLGAMENWKR